MLPVAEAVAGLRAVVVSAFDTEPMEKETGMRWRYGSICGRLGLIIRFANGGALELHKADDCATEFAATLVSTRVLGRSKARTEVQGAPGAREQGAAATGRNMDGLTHQQLDVLMG